MTKKKWIKENYVESIIWRSTQDPTITVEIHEDYNDDEEGDRFWYIFPAHKGKGIPNSPHVMYEHGDGYTKKDAIEYAKDILKLSINKIKKFDWYMLKW